MIAAYLLWLFLGLMGAHRFYLRRPVSGGLQLGLLIVTLVLNSRPATSTYGAIAVAWALWWLADAFLIPGWVRQDQSQPTGPGAAPASQPQASAQSASPGAIVTGGRASPSSSIVS